jgi:hypothetical protein
MGIYEEFASDAIEILAEIPKTVTVKPAKGITPAEHTFSVLMSQPMVMQDLNTGGFIDSTSYEIKFLRATAELHPGLVAYGNIVTFNNADFRIQALADRPPSAWIVAKVQSAIQ